MFAAGLTMMISLLLTMPIWFYLLYGLLERSNASELEWFLFWVYVPLTIVVQIAAKVIISHSEKKVGKWGSQ